MLTKRAGLTGLGVFVIEIALCATAALAQESQQEGEPLELTSEADVETGADQPIAVELAQGIHLLNEQIAQQQDLLKHAKTDREQELIRNHVRMLQKERRTFESLLHRLVGPDFELKEAAEERLERQHEQWERRGEATRDRQE